MRWLVVSVAVHAVVLAWFARGSSEQLTEWHVPALPAITHVETETFVELVDTPTLENGGGSRGTAPVRARSAHVASRAPDAWEQISVGMDTSGGGVGGDGDGAGAGHGHGIGFGNGGSVHVATDVPAPPPPPPISKARPAKLIFPTRDEDVDDEASLFTAKITVDADGDVIAAHMLTLRIGAKADRAASAIWTFRYEPALDDEGVPIRSTFEQSFQVR